MKLTKNEKQLLKMVVSDASMTNTQIAEKLDMTTQGVGKLKKSLKSKGLLGKKELKLNYDNLGIKFIVFALVKIMPKAFRRYKKEIDQIFADPNIILLANVPQTKITNIMMFGFRDVNEYSYYFSYMQSKLPGLLEIKESFVFSSENIKKNSASQLFLKMIEEHGEDDVSKPKPPSLNEDKK